MRTDGTYDQNCTRPVRPLDGTGAEISEVAGSPVRFFGSLGRLVGVMNDHGGAVVLAQERIKTIAKESTHIFL